jgi:hypothetical protein
MEGLHSSQFSAALLVFSASLVAYDPRKQLHGLLSVKVIVFSYDLEVHNLLRIPEDSKNSDELEK